MEYFLAQKSNYVRSFFSFLIFECTICTRICTYVCEWMWKPAIDVQCLLPLFFCLFTYFWANYPCICTNVCTWLWKPCLYLNSLPLYYFCVCSHVCGKPEVSVQCLQLFPTLFLTKFLIEHRFKFYILSFSFLLKTDFSLTQILLIKASFPQLHPVLPLQFVPNLLLFLIRKQTGCLQCK